MTKSERMPWASGRSRLVVIGLAATAVILFSIAVPLHAVAYGTNLPLAMLLCVGLCGAPLLSLARPSVAIAVFCVCAFALPLAVSPVRDQAWPWPWSVPALIAFVLFVAVITVARGWRLGLVPLVTSLLASLAVTVVLPGAASPGAVTADLIVTTSIAVVAFGVAVLLHGRLRVGAELTREREHTAAEQSRRILVEERARIARELHDVVAHSMSLIQVQASTARYRVAGLPPDGIAEFDDIAATARGSLTEMRRLLGVLRTDDEGPQLTPQQGLAAIPDLVDATRRAGVDVSLAFVPPAEEPPASVQIAAFRIVQEAVSNAVRHAPGSSIRIDVGSADHAVTIRVHNDASAQPVDYPRASSSSGHGLRGMRERVALVDGRLTVGPDAGGWTVHATLPWNTVEEDPS